MAGTRSAIFDSGSFPQSKAGTSKPQPVGCVIVKRHSYKFGENLSRFHPHCAFDYVEGDHPPNFKWRSELGDGDVRELEAKGGKMVVLRTDYQLADLEDARKQCKACSNSPETGI